MSGDERVRFCSACEKNVHNLSALTRREAEGLLRASSGNLCARFIADADGGVLTLDRNIAWKRRVVAGFSAALALITPAVAQQSKAQTELIQIANPVLQGTVRDPAGTIVG